MGRLADKFKRRSYFLLIPQTCLIIAYSILTPLAPKIASNIGVTYFAVILACIGNYPITPGSSAWISNNLAGPLKRAIGLAYMFSINNIGAVGGSFIFQDSEAPSYLLVAHLLSVLQVSSPSSRWTSFTRISTRGDQWCPRMKSQNCTATNNLRSLAIRVHFSDTHCS